MTREGVRKFREKHDPTYEPKASSPAHLRNIPWRVKASFHETPGWNAMYYPLTVVARGENTPLRDSDEVRVWHFKQKLSKLKAVVHYDDTNGFVLVPRRDGVDLGLIREPGLDDEGNVIPNWVVRKGLKPLRELG